MKKQLSILLLCLPIIGFGQQMTYVPDNNFEQALINLGYDNVLDDSVLTANINTVTNLGIYSKNIADLTGIEDFAALTELHCYVNNLTSLDVSNNATLQKLFCWDNQLTILDVSNNPVLNTLYCQYNHLGSLDVRNGNNTNIINFNSLNNPSLYCIDVDDAAWSTANWTNIDAWASFSTNCSAVYGCIDSSACNYNSLATNDNGSCGYNTASYDTLSVTASIVWNGMNLNTSGDYSDTLTNSVGCDSIANLNLTVTNPTGVIDLTNKSILVKITDMLGQETPYRKNTPLFYIYNDGTVEKKIIIE